MVSLYRNLYVENRADALEALDSLPQIKHAHSLKGKILFSMIVVSLKYLAFVCVLGWVVDCRYSRYVRALNNGLVKRPNVFRDYLDREKLVPIASRTCFHFFFFFWR